MPPLLEIISRSIAKGFVRLYYPQVEITGAALVPPRGPVLLVANHANSLIDPVMVSMASRRSVRFFAKAPLFETPVLGPLMRALGMLPAFRGQDGAAQVRRNLESLQIGVDALVNGDAVGIFPEGKSHDSLQLEQIRSGAARMAVQAASQGAQGLVVVPVGINYEHKERFRSTVWLRVGEPLKIEPPSSDTNEKAYIRSVTAAIDRGLKEVVLHLDDAAFTPFLHELELLLPQRRLHQTREFSALRQRKRIADAMNYFLAHDRPRAEQMAGALREFEHRLRLAHVAPDSFVIRPSRSVTVLFLRTFWLIAALPVALAGVIFHLVPFVITRMTARKLEQGRPTTALSRLGVGLPIYAVWYAAAWFALREMLPLWATWLTIALCPVIGVITLVWCRRLQTVCRDWPDAWRALSNKEQVAQLRAEQERLRQQLRHFSDDYEKVAPVHAE